MVCTSVNSLSRRLTCSNLLRARTLLQSSTFRYKENSFGGLARRTSSTGTVCHRIPIPWNFRSRNVKNVLRQRVGFFRWQIRRVASCVSIFPSTFSGPRGTNANANQTKHQRIGLVGTCLGQILVGSLDYIIQSTTLAVPVPFLSQSQLRKGHGGGAIESNRIEPYTYTYKHENKYNSNLESNTKSV